MHILIVEGNTPALISASKRAGHRAGAEAYELALASAGQDARFTAIVPSGPTFDPMRLELERYDGVAFTGSGVSWSADDQRARAHRTVMERAFMAGLPVIGSCYGLQLGAVVLGGSVGAHEICSEIGIARAITLSDAGSAHPLMRGRAERFDAVCIHRDEVKRMPEGATLLAGNAHSRVQAMAYENGGVRFWGMQYHPELTLRDIAGYLQQSGRVFDMDHTARRAAVLAWNTLDDEGEANASIRAAYHLMPDVLASASRRVELHNWMRLFGPVQTPFALCKKGTTAPIVADRPKHIVL